MFERCQDDAGKDAHASHGDTGSREAPVPWDKIVSCLDAYVAPCARSSTPLGPSAMPKHGAKRANQSEVVVAALNCSSANTNRQADGQ